MGMSFEEKYGKEAKSGTEPKALVKGDEPLTEEQAFIKLICNTVFRSVAVIFVTFGGCTMHSNMFDDDRLLAEAELEKAKAIHSTASNAADLEEVKAIERLINNGTDPVLARCAIMGYTGTNSRCKVITPTPVVEVETSATPAE